MRDDASTDDAHIAPVTTTLLEAIMTNVKLHHHSIVFKAFAVAALFSLTACGASSGTMVKPQQVSGFATGHTTYDDVVAQLGQPTTVKNSADGTRTASFTHTSVRARPESFIPLVGGFVGGADGTAHTVDFRFDRKGVLTGIDTQDTAMGSNTM